MGVVWKIMETRFWGKNVPVDGLADIKLTSPEEA